MQPGQGDLGGADQEELVLGHLVDLVAIAGQEAGPDERLLADEDRRDDGLVPLGADQLDREADQGQLQQHQVALQVGEAGAGEPRRRLHLDQAQLGADLEVVAGLEVELGPLADLADDDRVLLGHPVGGVGVGQVGERDGDPVEVGFDPLQLGLAGLDLLLQPLDPLHQVPGVAARLLGLADLLGERLALGLGVLDLGQQLAAAGVERQQLVDLLGRAAAGKRRLDPLGVGADQLQVEHRRGGVRARSRRAAASFRRPGRRTWRRSARRLRLRAPTTMFWGMIAPEKPPFWIAKRASW